MYLVHVYPLLKGVAPHSLTYFSRTKYPRGACVRVPVRSKETLGIVHKVESAQTARTRVRSAAHTLSNLKKQIPTFPFSHPFVRAVESTAHHFCIAPGALFAFLLPTAVGASIIHHTHPRSTKAGTGYVHHVLQASEHEREDRLKTFVREQLAHARSVLVVTENRHSAYHAYQTLASGIDPARVALIHGGLTKRQLLDVWNRTASEKAPMLIIASQTYCALVRSDLGAVVVQNASSSGYRHDTRPYVDMRHLLRTYAAELAVPLVYADTILDPGSHHHLFEGNANELSPIVWNVRQAVPIEIVDMRSEKDPVISNALSSAVHDVLQSGKSVCLFSGRKGIAGSVVCGDCGTPVRCARCEAPLALMGPKGEITVPRLFCRRCGEVRDSRERCPSCTSWKLVSLGAGSELYESALKKRFPKTPILRIDSDTAPTDSRARALADLAASAPSVTIATERALPFLAPTYDSVIYASIDALLSLPEYDASNKTLRVVLDGYLRARSHCFIQTRQPEHPLVVALTRNTLQTFTETELALRKTLRFPPFATLVHIARTGEKAKVQHDIAKLRSQLSGIYPTYVTPFQDRSHRGSELTVVILPGVDDSALRALIALLPAHFLVRVVSE